MVVVTTRTVALPFVAVAAVVALTACSSAATAGHPSRAAGAGSGATTTATPRSSAAPAASSAAALSTALEHSVGSVHSLHLTLTGNVAGAALDGTGDEQLAGGKLHAFQLTEALPGGQSVRVVIVGTKVYAKLPRGALSSTSTKPYVLISPTSSNPTIRSIARSLESALQSASVDSIGDFTRAASSVTDRGRTGIDGQPVTHYSVVVDPQKLPADLPGRSALTKTGITSIPLELYVDGRDRPVQVSEHLTVAGRSTSSTVRFSRYDQPVTISAPPAGQVGTS